MRILMLNYEFPPIGGGAGNANQRMLEQLASRAGFDVDLVTSSPEHSFDTDQFAETIRIFKLNVKKREVHHWRMSEIVRWTWKAYHFARRRVRETHYDLCHCWSGWPAGIVGYMLRKKLPYIVALRGSDVPGSNPRLERLDKYLIPFVSRRVWTAAQRVTTLSNYSTNIARHTLDCDFRIIRNGIDIEQFSPVANSGRTADDGLRLLTVSRLSPNKGTEYIVRAMKLLTQRDLSRDVHLTIVGSGAQERELRTLVDELGIGSRIQFTGSLPHEQLPDVYRRHDVFLLASLHEAAPNVILEAMASGLAIVTTRTGAAELIDGNGLTVAKRDAADIADKIEKLASDSNLLASFKRRSVEIAETRTWADCCDDYVALYREVVGQTSEERCADSPADAGHRGPGDRA